KKELIVKNVSWILGEMPKLPLKVRAKIRYRHKSVAATIYKILNTKYKILFSSPQRAITPGQSVVFYKGGELLGGGIIKE
ncbi:MAG: tRNA 2-thiouridine(34) synthase MnmA, partial [bacterium]|nr:tRNA 2-thiouridine(34) synthase MnmA [bacterium]